MQIDRDEGRSRVVARRLDVAHRSQIGRPGRFPVTLDQWPPESRVTCTWPSLVPAQIRPFRSRLRDRKHDTRVLDAMLSGVRPPELCWRALSLSVKSG